MAHKISEEKEEKYKDHYSLVYTQCYTERLPSSIHPFPSLSLSLSLLFSKFERREIDQVI